MLYDTFDFMKRETVYVGLSGGVDSAVSAKRLIDAGHNVVGVFIKVWQPDFLSCNWEAERLDAMRVAAHLQIPFLTFDAVDAYKKEVADYMISEYKEGRVPNPDVMCNQHVKFGAFLQFARRSGADKVATGHYAQVKKQGDRFVLHRGADQTKDQSYFLWTLTQEQLAHIYFPVGDTLKVQIRKEAERAELPVFNKHDSQGICFLGQVDIEEFLSHYIKTEKGRVLDVQGNHIGTHHGAVYYTLGQRQGFSIFVAGTESKAHYVVKKDLHTNTITVDTKPRVLISSKEKIMLRSVNRIQPSLEGMLTAEFRYRQKPFRVEIREESDDYVMLTVLDEGIEIPSVGQSCVLYRDDECILGGIIS